MRALLLVFISLTAEAQAWRARGVNGGGFFGPAQGGRAAVSGRVRQPQGSLGAFFEFAPASGAGLRSATPFCDAIPSAYKNGAWFCIDGAGTMASGSNISLTATGSPTTESTRRCPNGLDCTAASGTRASGAASGYLESSTVDRNASITTGKLTACWMGVWSNLTSAGLYGAIVNDGTGRRKYGIYQQTSGLGRVEVSTSACAAATFTTLVNINPAPPAGSRQLQCVTLDLDGDDTWYSYANGVNTSSVGSGGTICGGGTNSRYSFNGIWGGAALASTLGQQSEGFFEVPYAMTAGELAALSAAVNPTAAPPGTKGEAQTFARGSDTFCESSSGFGSYLRTNQPCISRNGIRIFPATTVISARANELDNPYWTATAAVTANQALAPDYTWDADQLNDSSGVAIQDVSATIATTSATRHSWSCFLSAGTASSATLSFTGASDAVGDCTTTATGIPATGAWYTCSSAAAYGASPTTVTVRLGVGTVVADTGTIFASYCNHTPDAPYGMRTPAIRTVAAGATRALDDVRFNSVVRSPSVGSAALSWAPATGVQSLGSATANSGFFGSESAGRFLYAGTTAIQNFDGTAVAATGVWGGTADVAARFSSSWQATRELRATGVADVTGASFDGLMGTAGSGIGLGGAIWAAGNMPGTYSRVCFDPDPTRCR